MKRNKKGQSYSVFTFVHGTPKNIMVYFGSLGETITCQQCCCTWGCLYALYGNQTREEIMFITQWDDLFKSKYEIPLKDSHTNCCTGDTLQGWSS